MRRVVFFLLFWAVCTALSWADNSVALNEKGNKAFAEKGYKEALEFYRQAEVERPETPQIAYNHANALVETGGYEEAIELYDQALNTDDVSLQAKAYYNTGNGYFLKEDYRQAIEAYQKSLELIPDDMDAKFNLELARSRLKEQMQRQPQDQKQQQQQQEQQQQQQQPNDQKNQPQDQQKGQDSSQDKPQRDKDKQQDQQRPQNQEQMSKEDAMRILRAMEDSEKDLQKEQKRVKVQGTTGGKDW